MLESPMKEWVKEKDVEQPHLSLPGNCEKLTGMFHYKVSRCEYNEI